MVCLSHPAECVPPKRAGFSKHSEEAQDPASKLAFREGWLTDECLSPGGSQRCREVVADCLLSQAGWNRCKVVLAEGFAASWIIILHQRISCLGRENCLAESWQNKNKILWLALWVATCALSRELISIKALTRLLPACQSCPSALGTECLS